MVFYIKKEDMPFRLNKKMAARYMSSALIDRVQEYRNLEHINDSYLAYLLLAYCYKSQFPSESVLIDPRYTENKKPYLSDEFHFNISHSDTIVACAVSDAPIGVDVQEITPYHDDYSIVFSAREEKYINASSDKDSIFTILWTCKEAYGKAIGLGLLYECSKTEFVHNGVLKQSIEGKVITTKKLDNAYLSVCGYQEEEIYKLNPSIIINSILGVVQDG